MRNRGFTLIELMVSLGVFTIVMTIAAGGYLVMINVNRHAQGIATGINNLSFALDTMTRSIRTGTNYSCDGSGDCSAGGASLSFIDQDHNRVTYAVSSDGTAIQSTEVTPSGNSVVYRLTEPSVTISKLTFYVSGTASASAGDYSQPHVTMVVSGSVSVGPGTSQSFTVQTGATMRGNDL